MWKWVLQVVQLKVDGVAFRLIPESTQVKNALTVSDSENEQTILLLCLVLII